MGGSRAIADEIGLFALLGAYKSDNPRRVANGAISDTVTSLNLASYGNKAGGRFRTDWDVGITQANYSENSFAAKPFANALWTGEAQVIPELLKWSFQENFGQILINAEQPDTPINRANFNTFSTGPDLRIPLTSQYWFDAIGKYTSSNYGLGGLGGQETKANAGINKRLGYGGDLGIYVGESRGSIDTLGDYKTQEAYLSYALAGSRTKLSGHVGIERALLPVSTGNLPYADISASRKLPSGSSLELTVSRSLTTASEQFSTLAGHAISGGQPTDLNTLNSLYQAKYVRLGYAAKHNRTEIKFGVSWRDESSLPGTPTNDRRFTAVDASWYRVWGPKTGIRLYGVYAQQRLQQPLLLSDRDFEYGIELAHPWGGPGLRWVINIDRSQRISSDPAFRYTENRIGFLLRYSKFVYQHTKL